jgi:hypothetical protein
MKKVIVILLLMVYGVSSMGMTVHFHYCCGKLKTVDLTPAKADKCLKKSSYGSNSKPCCEEQKVELKIKDDQSAAKVFNSLAYQEAVNPNYEEHFINSPEVHRKLITELFSPPPYSSQSLFILNCVFRI